MPTPPSVFVEPRDAVQRVRHAFACTGDEAVEFLLNAWLAGTIAPRLIGSPPPAGYDPRDADWFSGEIVISTQQQTSTIPIGDYDPFDASYREQLALPPREYRYPMRMLTKRYPFKIDRRQLEVILAGGSPVVDSDEPGPRPAPGAVCDRQPPQSERAEGKPILIRHRVRPDATTVRRLESRTLAASERR